MNDNKQPDDSLPDLSSDGADSRETPRKEAVESKRDQIGPYKILQKIAEGGMGAVFMAQQSEPIKRRVALKLIKAGRDTEQIIARFDAERQALAMMDHANIARIFDAGTTADGSPYFVMELVNGIPLTEYCDNNKLSIRERLELFVPVCKAVQHAHTKGIIHRDLKPSNVLVALYDGVPVPKVIDFGLAKATEHQLALTDKTMFTEFGQVVGTIQYMSPEQAEMNQLDIDTRTDVYSLGVMLYELLTGSTPLDDNTMKEQALLKVLELIRESEPPRPSTRLSGSGDVISGVSDQRRIEPSRLQKLLRGELDWIVMKSLEKDRTRRYETPNDFAQDISNFLNDEAVTARPPSRGYRLQKLIRKNRGLFYSLGALASVLLAGVAVSTWFAVQANITANKLEESNEDLVEANTREQKARELAQANEQKAKQQSQLALETLTSVIGDIQSGVKNLSGSGEIRRRLLKTSLSKLERVSTEFLDQASVDHQTIRALFDMGRLVMEFGTSEEPGKDLGTGITDAQSSAVALALQFFERAQQMAIKVAKTSRNDEQAQRDLSFSFKNIGDVQLKLGDTQAALEAYRRGLEISESLAAVDKDNATAQRDLSMSLAKLGDVQLILGDTLSALEAYKRSLTNCEALAALDKDNAEVQRDLSSYLNRIGDVELRLGNTQSAMEAYKGGLKISESLAAVDKDDARAQRDLSIAFDAMGVVQFRLGDTQAALEMYRNSLKIKESLATVDKDNASAQRDLSYAFEQMGIVQFRLGDTQAALEMYRNSLKIYESLAAVDKDNAQAQRNLSDSFVKIGVVQLRLGNAQSALEAYKSSLKICESLAAENKDSGWAQSDLADSYIELGKVQFRGLGNLEAALEAYNRALKIRQAISLAASKDSGAQRDLLVTYQQLGALHLERGDSQAALEALNLGLEILKAWAQKDADNAELQRDLCVYYINIGDVQDELGEHQAALDGYENALKISEARTLTDPQNAQANDDLSICCQRIGDVQLDLGNAQAALDAYGRALKISEAMAGVDPENSGAQESVWRSHSGLGDTFVAARDYSRAVTSFEAATSILRLMIRKGQQVDSCKRYLAILERDINSAETAEIAFGDWGELLKHPAKSLPELLDSRSIEFASQKNFTEATKAARKLRELKESDDGNLYNAACVFALAAASIEPAEGDELNSKQSEQRQAWIDEAITSLKQSIAAGWDDFDHMRADTDLTILRDLPEFRTLSKPATSEQQDK